MRIKDPKFSVGSHAILVSDNGLEDVEIKDVILGGSVTNPTFAYRVPRHAESIPESRLMSSDEVIQKVSNMEAMRWPKVQTETTAVVSTCHVPQLFKDMFEHMEDVGYAYANNTRSPDQMREELIVKFCPKFTHDEAVIDLLTGAFVACWLPDYGWTLTTSGFDSLITCQEYQDFFKLMESMREKGYALVRFDTDSSKLEGFKDYEEEEAASA